MAKVEKGVVFTSNNVIDYAEGGVVSKELVHSNAGSVTLFSFDAGQGLSEQSCCHYYHSKLFANALVYSEFTCNVKSDSKLKIKCI